MSQIFYTGVGFPFGLGSQDSLQGKVSTLDVYITLPNVSHFTGVKLGAA
jgi:hypothetical protein